MQVLRSSMDIYKVKKALASGMVGNHSVGDGSSENSQRISNIVLRQGTKQ